MENYRPVVTYDDIHKLAQKQMLSNPAVATPPPPESPIFEALCQAHRVILDFGALAAQLRTRLSPVLGSEEKIEGNGPGVANRDHVLARLEEIRYSALDATRVLEDIDRRLLL